MRLEGWGGLSGGHPKSGLPDFGDNGAQVGYSRPCVFETRFYEALLTMRPDWMPTSTPPRHFHHCIILAQSTEHRAAYWCSAAD
jgi:hypothetical protein